MKIYKYCVDDGMIAMCPRCTRNAWSLVSLGRIVRCAHCGYEVILSHPATNFLRCKKCDCQYDAAKQKKSNGFCAPCWKAHKTEQHLADPATNVGKIVETNNGVMVQAVWMTEGGRNKAIHELRRIIKKIQGMDSAVHNGFICGRCKVERSFKNKHPSIYIEHMGLPGKHPVCTICFP